MCTLLLMLLLKETGRCEACQWRCALSRYWRAGRPIDSQVPDIMSPPFSAPVTSNHINPAAQIRGQAVLLLFGGTGRPLLHKGIFAHIRDILHAEIRLTCQLVG